MRWSIASRAAAMGAIVGAALVVVAGEVPVVAIDRAWLVVFERVVGVALLVGAGLLAFVPRPSLLVVAVVTAIAISGFAFIGRPGRLQGPGMLAGALAVPLLFVLAAILSGATSNALGRRLAMPAIAVAAASAAVRTLIYEPFADVHCERVCTHNPILVVTHLAAARSLGVLDAGVNIALALLITWQMTQPRRAPRGGLVRLRRLCATAAALALGAEAAVRLRSGTVLVPGDVTVASFVVTLSASAFIALALILAAVDPLRARRDVERITRLLAGAEGRSDVQTIFRHGFGDPDLQVGYWDSGLGYLDSDGEPIRSSRGAHIELTSRGSPLAVIVSGREAVSSELVTQQLGAQARLAIHNESLTYELRRSVAEVARSRRRIVEVSDAERCRLERDLHDGAQQRLLALSFELRRGERAALAANDGVSGVALGSAYALAQTALEQLRHLAHGIHPATLSGSGLHDAVLEFAALSERNVVLTIDDADARSESTEATIYRILTAAIAESAPTTTPHITVKRNNERWITVNIAGVWDLPQDATDRIAAADGTCIATRLGVEVALPCAY